MKDTIMRHVRLTQELLELIKEAEQKFNLEFSEIASRAIVLGYKKIGRVPVNKMALPFKFRGTKEKYQINMSQKAYDIIKTYKDSNMISEATRYYIWAGIAYALAKHKDPVPLKIRDYCSDYVIDNMELNDKTTIMLSRNGIAGNTITRLSDSGLSYLRDLTRTSGLVKKITYDITYIN